MIVFIFRKFKKKNNGTIMKIILGDYLPIIRKYSVDKQQHSARDDNTKTKIPIVILFMLKIKSQLNEYNSIHLVVLKK